MNNYLCENCQEMFIEDEICPHCGGWHELYDEWKECYDELYTEARGLLYITTKWTQAFTIEISAWLADSNRGDTMKSLIWDSESGADFVVFICEREEAGDGVSRNYALLKSISEKILIGKV